MIDKKQVMEMLKERKKVLSYAKLAAVVNCDPQTLCRWLKGKNIISDAYAEFVYKRLREEK